MLVNTHFLRDVRLADLGRASCDPSSVVGKHVLVLGGGNVAMDCARTALRLGATKVDMACLESRDEDARRRWTRSKQAQEEGIDDSQQPLVQARS